MPRGREIKTFIDHEYLKGIINNSYLDELGYIKTDTNLNDEQIKKYIMMLWEKQNMVVVLRFLQNQQ